jgi:hypothetical protein
MDTWRGILETYRSLESEIERLRIPTLRIAGDFDDPSAHFICKPLVNVLESAKTNTCLPIIHRQSKEASPVREHSKGRLLADVFMELSRL